MQHNFFSYIIRGLSRSCFSSDILFNQTKTLKTKTAERNFLLEFVVALGRLEDGYYSATPPTDLIRKFSAPSSHLKIGRNRGYLKVSKLANYCMV